jgi:hypothetical protein
MQEVRVVTIDEEFEELEKSRVKAHVRTRKGKLERVKEFERRGGKKSKFDSLVSNIVKELESVKVKHPLSKKLKEFAIKNFKKASKFAEDYVLQHQQISMDKGDAKSYLKLALAIDNKQYKKANDIITGMDTDPRENIPKSVFKFLKKKVDLDWDYS